MRWVIALLIMLFACSVARAEVYQWVDEKGVVHFTDNPDNIPAAYRHKVKMLGPSRPQHESIPSAPENPPAVASPQPRQGTVLYGGHHENWWRSTLAASRAEVLRAREQLAAKKDSLSMLHHKRVVFQRPSDRVAYNALAEEISRDEDKIKRLEESLSKLEAEAENLGVPVEARK